MSRPVRLGMDVRFALFSVRAGLFTHHRELVTALRKLGGIEIRLFLNRWTLPADRHASVEKTVREAFDLPLHITSVPGTLQPLRMLASPFRGLDVFYHVPGGQFGPIPGIANIYLVPDLIPIVLDYPIDGFKDQGARYLTEATTHARRLIVYSTHTRRDLEQRLGVPPARVVVTPLAAGDDYRPEGPSEVAEVKEALGGSPYVLHVGTLELRKNLDTLVRAYAAMRRQHPGLRHKLVLCGSKWVGFEPIFAAIAQESLEGDVLYVGRVDRVDALYRGASLVVFPSIYEGFGLPPLEAMACGVPVICSNATSLPEVVGDAGILVDPHDVDAMSRAMAQVLTDPALAASLRQRGPERSRQFTWEATARAFKAAVLDVVAEKSSSSPGHVR